MVWSPTAQEHVARQISLLSGGTPPDVMRLPAWSAPTFYNEEAARRLDAYFKRDGFKTDNLAPPFDVSTFKRGWFALPRGQSGTWALFYNRQLFSPGRPEAPGDVLDVGRLPQDGAGADPAGRPRRGAVGDGAGAPGGLLLSLAVGRRGGRHRAHAGELGDRAAPGASRPWSGWPTCA